MALFNQPSGPGTVVGVNVKLQGQLKDSQDIVVHGQVEGEVASERNVTITETAAVKGPVLANMVTVGGTVRGSIEARDKLEILPSGKVYGSIATKELTVRPGAIFNGRSSMSGKAAEKEAKKEKKEELAKMAEKPAEGPELGYEVES